MDRDDTVDACCETNIVHGARAKFFSFEVIRR